MEKEKNNPTKDPIPTKIDIWDRLIKLEKRNSHITMLNDMSSQISNEEDNEQMHFWWPEGQVDKNIRSYWNQLNEIYFQGTKDIEVGRIDELVKFLQTAEKDVSVVKYADPSAYETFKEVIAESFKHFYSDSTLDRINVHNLQKQFYITMLKQRNINCDSPDIVTLPVKPKGSYLQDKAKFQNESDAIKAYLNKESKELNDLIAQIHAEEKLGKDEISVDLNKFAKESQALHKENQKSLSNLKESVLCNIEAIAMPSEERKSPNKNKKGLKKLLKSDNLDDPSIADLQLKYLQKLIVKLENQQTAETIKCVLDCKKLTGSKGYQFCIVFDEALAGKRFWIEESILQKLDNLRERSLFKVYDIPQHIKRSTYSPNILGFEFCNKKADNAKSSSLRDQNWKDLMKERLGEENTGGAREKFQDKLAQMGMCHNCRHLYPEDFLVRCNYQNTIVNFQLNSSLSKTKKDLKSYKKSEESTVKPLWDERRQPYLFYRRQEGEIMCYRKFCRLCLKMNHDASTAQNAEITSILCQFCKKTCCCSRCNRNEHIDKLRTLYVSLGGDLESIKKESYFEKYICHHDEQLEEIINQKKSVKFLTKTLQKAGYALKPTKGKKLESVGVPTKYKIEKYKKNVENLKFMKNLRIQMEKARMLCSQVSKRESVKMHTSLVRTDLFNLEVAEVFNLTGKKREGPDLGKKTPDEPNITKKVKTGNKSTESQKMEVEHNNQEEDKEEKDKLRGSIVVVKKRGRPRKDTSIGTEKSEGGNDDRGGSASSDKSSPLKKKNNLKNSNITVKQMKEKIAVKKTPKATKVVVNVGDQAGKALPEMRGRSKEIPTEREKQVHANPSLVKKQQNSSNTQKKNSEAKESKKTGKSKDMPKIEIENIEIKEKSQGHQPSSEKSQKNRSPKIALRGLAMTKPPLGVLKQNSNSIKSNRQGEKSHPANKELQRILDYQHEDQFEFFKTTKSLGRVTRNSNNKNKLRNNKKYHYSQ